MISRPLSIWKLGYQFHRMMHLQFHSFRGRAGGTQNFWSEGRSEGRSEGWSEGWLEGGLEGRLKGWLGDSHFHSFRGRAGGTVGAGGAIGPSTYGLRNIRETVRRKV